MTGKENQLNEKKKIICPFLSKCLTKGEGRGCGAKRVLEGNGEGYGYERVFRINAIRFSHYSAPNKKYTDSAQPTPELSQFLDTYSTSQQPALKTTYT